MNIEKKSTYNAKSQKKYNKKRKQIAASVNNNFYDEIKQHAQNKGFTSINSYVIDLIKRDMDYAKQE